jgi:hypothetical protein
LNCEVSNVEATNHSTISSTGEDAIRAIKKDLAPTIDRYFAPIKGIAAEVGRTMQRANAAKRVR